MDRKDLDLNGVSRSFTRNPVLITCSGSDPSFSVYQHALTSHFARNPAVWKRNGKVFPHLLTFPLKFVQYEEKTCFGPQITASEITKIAYLHVFNINVTTADDYRANVRHNVSDWFAKLNSKSDVQWIIVINTTRTKDKKSRTMIMDKIKSDFSKFQSKLFELPDTSDHTAFAHFVQGIQQSLFLHLNLVIEIWDRSLKTAYEKKKQHNWDPYAYFLSMSEYGRCHWSFGAIEFSISIFDDLEQLLHEFVMRASESDSPRWLTQILNTSIDDRPSLVKNIGIQSLQKKESHYLGMRNYLLCQQIVMAVHLYQHKMKSNDAAPSLRSDCSIDILRRTLMCIDSVKEFNTQMNNKRDLPKTNCWIWWTVSEAIDICSLLCDISHLDVAPPIISRLQLARFEALHALAKHVKLNPGDGEALLEWLKINETIESKLLAVTIQSPEAMAHELEKSHDVCVAALTHSNRHRNALLVTNKLFSYLRSCNMKVPIQKVSIGRRTLKALPVQNTTSIMLKNLFADDLESISNSSLKECLSLLFFISQCENGKDEKTNELFLKKCEESKEIISWSSICETQQFEVILDAFEPVRTTDSKFATKCQVISKLGFELERSKVKLHFSSSPSSNIVQREDLSVLALQHDTRDQTCRLVSELKMRKTPESSSDDKLDENRFVIESKEFSLVPGSSSIDLSTVIAKVGCFVLEKVSIVSQNLRFETTVVHSRKPPFLYCIATPHLVTIVNDSKPFLAGVMQKVEIELEAKCDVEEESVFNVLDNSSFMKFLDRSSLCWLDTISIQLKPMKSLQKVVLEVFLWLKVDSSICETAAVQKRVLNIEWMNRKYSIPINFVPIMVINSKTSMLTTDILLEVEMNRAAGPDITTIVREANLKAIDPTGGVETEAELLTLVPIDCEIHSIVNFVFKLPSKGSSLKHRLHLEYTIKNEFNLNFTDEEVEKMEALMYYFDDEVELCVPDVKFEICTQVLSQQPGAQLCRASSPCHFVISIRCLKDMPCTLFVVLDADDRMWTISERTKIVAVKESGLGQLALSITPVVAGFLPFPTVSIYECQQAPGHSDTVIPGSELLCFNRTAGKQIRVLSANNSENNNSFAKDDSSRGSNRIAKKIGKLFD